MEIIKRKMVAEKETFVTGFNDAYNMQVSYNSNGCIALRFHKSENKEDDTLMVLSRYETQSLIRFIRMIKED